MITKLTEIYEHDSASTNLPSNQANGKRKYALRDVFVNAAHVVCLRSEVNIKRQINEDRVFLVEGNLKPAQEFTRVYLDRGQTGIDIVVLGAPTQVESFLAKKNLLKG